MVNNLKVDVHMPPGSASPQPPLRLLKPVECLIVKKEDRSLISNGPIYSLAVAQSMLTLDTMFVLNDKANEAMSTEFTPELLDEDLLHFIMALVPTDRVNSERCETSIRRIIDCDSYAMKWNRFVRKRWNDAQKIYVKFGFIESNPKLLVISIHPSIKKK